MAIYSIGLDCYAEVTLVNLMKIAKIKFLIDVRHPSTKCKQWCLPKHLKAIVGKSGIKYLCWIREVWSDYENLSCNNAGQNIENFKNNPSFICIIDRLLKGANKTNILLSCSHGKNEYCIINNVIAVLLEENNISVHSIESIIIDKIKNSSLLKLNQNMAYNNFWHDNELEDWWR